MGLEATRTKQRELKGASLSAGITPVPSAIRNGTETSPVDLSIAAAPHGKHTDQEAHAKGNSHSWVWMGANCFVCRFGCGDRLFFQTFAGLFGLLNGTFQFCSNVRLFVIFGCNCIHSSFSCFGSYLPFGNHQLSRCASEFGGCGVAAAAKSEKVMRFTGFMALRPA